MRDIAITLIVFIGCVYTLKKPYIGVLLWSWLSYMNPHRLAFGFAYNAPFAYSTALTLLISTLFSKQPKRIPLNAITSLWIFFILFMGLTTLKAYFPLDAMEQFTKVVKIQLIIFMTMMLVTDLIKLKQLITVIVISIGYYSVKGGVFTLLSGGSFKVWGPDGSFIEDNNGLAVAVLMVIPLMVYLYQTTINVYIKNLLLFAIITSLFTVLGSQSRGAFLAIAAVAVFFWFKSDNKLLSGILIVVLGFALLAFMPESWHQRMGTINNYEEDNSSMGRINAWHYAINAANDNLLGMGFESWYPSTFAVYAPNPSDVHAAHSIYFTVLADHGWIGLLLFLLIFAVAWIKLSFIIKVSTKNTSLKEYLILARMLQVGFIAYFSGGAFLSLSYFDLPWHFVSFVVLLGEFIEKGITSQNLTPRIIKANPQN